MAKLQEQGQRQVELREEIDTEVASFLFIGGLERVVTARVLNVLQTEPEDEQDYDREVVKTVVGTFINGLAAEERLT